MYKLTVVGLPSTLNKFYSGMHWSKRKKIVDEWHDRIGWAIKTAKIPKKLSCPIGLTTHQFSRGTPRDTDNCVISAKFMKDMLVKMGYIPDDTPKYVEFDVLRSSKGKSNCVVYLIHEL